MTRSEAKHPFLLAVLFAIVSILLSLSLTVFGPLITGILLLSTAIGLWLITDIEHAFFGIIAVIAFLPYGTLPFKIIITPTFLDIALAVLIFLYIMEWMTGERRNLQTTPIHLLIIGFIILVIFSFVAGLRYAGLTSTILRRFAELVLSMTLSIVVIDMLRTTEAISKIVRIIFIAGAASAAVAIVIWLLPDTLSNQMLTSLSVVGYPGGHVLQYIESNPGLPERAIGTGMNPNSMGGFMVMLAALTAPQMLEKEAVIKPRWLAVCLWGLLGLCLFLTFSRGALLALAFALIFISAVRYRKFLLILAGIGVIALILPWTQYYIQRLLEGFQGADLSTQMRFGEYKDAIELISRYPVFGVGFAGTPDIDIYLGVANVYLTIASNMGILGLTAFLLLTIGIFIYAAINRKKIYQNARLFTIWLGAHAAIAGVLANGIFDLYYFNLEFHHIVTFFWIFVGLSVASTRLGLEETQNYRVGIAEKETLQSYLL